MPLHRPLERTGLCAEDCLFAATLVCIALGMVLPAGGLAFSAWRDHVIPPAAASVACQPAGAGTACLPRHAHVS